MRRTVDRAAGGEQPITASQPRRAAIARLSQTRDSWQKSRQKWKPLKKRGRPI